MSVVSDNWAGLEGIFDGLFVDDDPDLVAATVSLGYRGVALIREGEPPAAVDWITSLEALPVS